MISMLSLCEMYGGGEENAQEEPEHANHEDDTMPPLTTVSSPTTSNTVTDMKIVHLLQSLELRDFFVLLF
jgi:hypothetical protein